MINTVMMMYNAYNITLHHAVASFGFIRFTFLNIRELLMFDVSCCLTNESVIEYNSVTWATERCYTAAGVRKV